MIKLDTRCSDDRLRSLLQAEDDDDGDEIMVSAKHIDDCPRCQARLEQLAAEPAEWRDARDSLLSGDEEGACRQDANGDRTWSHRRWQRRPTNWSESMSRQLLSPPSHPEMLGRIGRYEVERMIGAGGMGVVFKAFDTELNRPVAVKVLAPFLAGSGAARKRFAREARAAAAVVHEHVVSIHNVETEGESPFLVMQYVAGESLQGRIDREGPLDVCEILRIGMQTAAGLAAAHAQGLVHRDVKPSNILLEKGIERAMLTDFGLARASDDASLTHTGYHPGTPQFMSPEQAHGEPIDQRSDLFSLGSVLYAICTGRPPFRAETTYGVIRRITDDEPTPIRDINPDVPDWLCGIIAKLMAKRPADRFASAGEVAELLEDCLAHVQQPTAVPLPQSCLSLRESSKTDQPLGASPRFPRKSPAAGVRLIMGAALSFLLIFAGILIVLELNKGKLTIESEADDVPIRVMQGDKVVERLTVTRTGASVRIAAGQYIVEIDGKTNGITVEKGTVTLQRGGREIVRIVKEDHAPAVSDTANAVRDDVRGVLGSPRVEVNTIVIHVVDEQGKPIRKATVFRNHVYAPGESQRHKIENAKFETDANGTAVISLTGTPHDLRLWATKDGFCPLHAMWAKMFQADGDTIPDEFTFVMRRGTTIGGIVVDATGRPIPDVRVEVRDMTVQDHNINPKRPGKRPVGANMLAEGDTVVTNAVGRWELNNVPPDDVLLAGRAHDLGDPDKPAQTKPLLNLRFLHPRYEEKQWGVPQQKHDVTLDSLRTKTAKVVLPSKKGSAGDASPFHSSGTPDEFDVPVSAEEERVPATVDSSTNTMSIEFVLPHQFRMHWPGAVERSSTTARIDVPVSEPSHMRLDEIVGHHGLAIGMTIEPTDHASSEKFVNSSEAIRISFTEDDLPVLKATKSWNFPYEFTYDDDNGTAIAVIKITAQQRPVTPIADIKELEGKWRLVDADPVSDQPRGLPFHNLDGYKSRRIAIGGTEWRYIRDGNELIRKLEAIYDLKASPQTVDLKYVAGESEQHERRLFELHGDTLITAQRVNGTHDLPASFDEPMVLIEQYQRVGVVLDRSEVDEHTVSISLGTADDIRLNQQFQVSDGTSVLGTVEVYTIGEHASYARVLQWSADRPIRKGDRVSSGEAPVGDARARGAVDSSWQADKGQLTIASDTVKMPVRVTQGGKVVEKVTVTQGGESMRIAAGKYGMSIKDGDVTLNRGGPATMDIVRPDGVLDSSTAREPANRSQQGTIRQLYAEHQEFDQLLSEIDRSSMRDRGEVTFRLEKNSTDARACLVITASDENGEFLNFQTMTGVALGPDGQPIEIQIRQVAPGRYVGDFDTPSAGEYFVVVKPGPDSPSLKARLVVEPMTNEKVTSPQHNAAVAPIHEKLAEIRSQAHAALMSLETLQYRFEVTDDQGWHTNAEFYADHERFRVNRNDTQGMMGIDDEGKPIRYQALTIATAFDGQRQYYVNQNNEPLRVQSGREGAPYAITTPQLWTYGWLLMGSKDVRFDTLLSQDLWERRFKDAIYIGDVTEDGLRFDIVDFPQRLETATPCIYRVYFARDLGFLPLKVFRNTLAANEPSTTVRVTRFKTFTIDGKQIALPLQIQHQETHADGVSRKGERTIAVDEDSLKVNEPLVDSLFTLSGNESLHNSDDGANDRPHDTQ